MGFPDVQCSRIIFIQSDNTFCQRRFAAAALPDKSEDLTSAYKEIDILKHMLIFPFSENTAGFYRIVNIQILCRHYQVIFPGILLISRYSRDQMLCILMLRMIQNFLCISRFNDFSLIHHNDLLTDLFDNIQVMGNK